MYRHVHVLKAVDQVEEHTLACVAPSHQAICFQIVYAMVWKYLAGAHVQEVSPNTLHMQHMHTYTQHLEVSISYMASFFIHGYCTMCHAICHIAYHTKKWWQLSSSFIFPIPEGLFRSLASIENWPAQCHIQLPTVNSVLRIIYSYTLIILAL